MALDLQHMSLCQVTFESMPTPRAFPEQVFDAKAENCGVAAAGVISGDTVGGNCALAAGAAAAKATKPNKMAVMEACILSVN